MPTPTISNPDKLNYVFIRWNPAPAKKVTEDATYYAIWADDINNNGIADENDTYHTVTFVDGHTGNTIDTQRVLTGMAASAPNVPTHEGYVFTGWDNKFDKVESNLTVTATYAVDANGNGTPDNEDTYYTVTYQYDENNIQPIMGER